MGALFSCVWCFWYGDGLSWLVYCSCVWSILNCYWSFDFVSSIPSSSSLSLFMVNLNFECSYPILLSWQSHSYITLATKTSSWFFFFGTFHLNIYVHCTRGFIDSGHKKSFDRVLSFLVLVFSFNIFSIWRTQTTANLSKRMKEKEMLSSPALTK